jgi:hypothetical protein
MVCARRSLLALGAAALGLPVAPTAAQQALTRHQSMAAWRRRIESILARGRVPIMDLQATYAAGRTNLSRVMAYMDELDIAQTAFAVAFEPDGRTSVELHRGHPEYFIPTTNSGEFPRWWNDPLAFLRVARADLQTGAYFAMGEHEFRHYPSPEQAAAGQFQRDITVPIWCHLGMIRYPQRTTRYSPGYVRTLIERFPGLHFDLAVPAPWHVYQPSGFRDSTLFEPNGRIDDAWLAVLEQYPDRFLAASDYRPAVEDKMPSYIAKVQREFVLGSLSEPARHLVAYRNAWRLITGEPWG